MCAAVGTITNDLTYVIDNGLTPFQVQINPQKSCIVTIDSVLSSILIVPGLKQNGEKVCLCDFGNLPFKIPLPLGMLREHANNHDVRVYAPGGAALHQKPTVQITFPTYKPQAEMDQNNVSCEPGGNNTDFTTNNDGEILADDGDLDSVEVTKKELGMDGLNLVQEARILCERIGGTFDSSNFHSEFLDDFKAVLADLFHQQKRPARVPIRHPFKNAYHMAIMEAFLDWNQGRLQSLINKLKHLEGWTDAEVKTKSVL